MTINPRLPVFMMQYYDALIHRVKDLDNRNPTLCGHLQKCNNNNNNNNNIFI